MTRMFLFLSLTKKQTNMESVFSRFNAYKFEADQRFVDGLKNLNKPDISRRESEQLNLKLFFYNRFVEPIDCIGYKQWSSSPHHGTGGEVITQEQDQRTLPVSDSSESISIETFTHRETKQLSFAEVMKLVQEGKEVPGVNKLDIQPSNQSPTPSRMDRPLKPWETSSS